MGWKECSASWTQDQELSLQFDPPRLGAPMRGLKEQVDQWAEGLSAACQSWLPETVEIPATRWRLPLVRRVSRSVEPQKVFSFAVENFGKPVLAEAMAGITETDFVIAREMEHAREVVEYGIESAKSGEIQDKDLLVEAIVNARSLLEEQARATVDLDLLDRKECGILGGRLSGDSLRNGGQPCWFVGSLDAAAWPASAESSGRISANGLQAA